MILEQELNYKIEKNFNFAPPKTNYLTECLQDFFNFVLCSDGSNQSGVLCAIYNLIEQMKNEKKVDVFRAVKGVRDLRMGAVGSFEQYKFCYAAAQEFIETSQFYEND